MARFRELLTSTGAVAEVEAEITRLVDASRAALDEVSGLPGARPEVVEALAELVELATARTA